MDATAQNLEELEPDALAEALVLIAQEVRSAVAQGDRLVPLRLLRRVQAAAQTARGQRLALLEISASFLKAMGNASFGLSELALREFLADGGESAAEFLAEVTERSMAIGALEVLPSQIKERAGKLLELGLLRSNNGRVDLRPDWRAVVRNMLEPVIFRHWREVEEARSAIGLGRHDQESAMALLSGRFGVSEDEARRFLKRTHTFVPTGNYRVLYESPGVVRRKMIEEKTLEAEGVTLPTLSSRFESAEVLGALDPVASSDQPPVSALN